MSNVINLNNNQGREIEVPLDIVATFITGLMIEKTPRDKFYKWGFLIAEGNENPFVESEKGFTLTPETRNNWPASERILSVLKKAQKILQEKYPNIPRQGSPEVEALARNQKNIDPFMRKLTEEYGSTLRINIPQNVPPPTLATEILDKSGKNGVFIVNI